MLSLQTFIAITCYINVVSTKTQQRQRRLKLFFLLYFSFFVMFVFIISFIRVLARSNFYDDICTCFFIHIYNMQTIFINTKKLFKKANISQTYVKKCKQSWVAITEKIKVIGLTWVMIRVHDCLGMHPVCPTAIR
jgi:uncharacterized membrane protein